MTDNEQTVREQKFDLSFKIMRGELLSEEEYNLALAYHFLMGSGDYAGWKLRHYQDDRIQGYLCLNPETGKINAKHHDGGSPGDLKWARKNKLSIRPGCLVGLHREDIDRKHLRDDQTGLW